MSIKATCVTFLCCGCVFISSGCGPSAADIEQERIEADLDLLVEAIHSEDRSARLDAIREAQSLGAAARLLVSDLSQMISGRDLEIQLAAIDALGAVGPDAVEALETLEAAKQDARLASAVDSAIKQISASPEKRSDQ